MKPLLLIIGSLLFWSCNTAHTKEEPTSTANMIDTVKNQTTSAPISLPEKVLLAYDVQHNFSSKENKDHFKLTIYGDSIYTGTILFQIITNDKRVIYSDTFSCRDLMGDLYDTAYTLKQKEDTIKWRASTYFSEDKFTNSLIDDSDKVYFSPDDKELEDNYNEIKADKNAIGFTFTYGYEGVYSIAYSRKKKKAVFYFISD